MPIGHPTGNVEQVVGYISLEFRGKVQAGDTHLRVINILVEWYVDMRLGREEDSRGNQE